MNSKRILEFMSIIPRPDRKPLSGVVRASFSLSEFFSSIYAAIESYQM